MKESLGIRTSYWITYTQHSPRTRPGTIILFHMHPLCSEESWQDKIPTAVVVDIVHIERASHVDSTANQVQTLITAMDVESKTQHHTRRQAIQSHYTITVQWVRHNTSSGPYHIHAVHALDGLWPLHLSSGKSQFLVISR